MSALSRKLRAARGGGILFWCPGCDGAHMIPVGEGSGPRWGYNGDPERPTFTPSVLVRGTVPPSDAQVERMMMGEKLEPVPFVCHSVVTDGRIQFLGDCSHALAGQTVDLPDFDQNMVVHS